MKKVKPVSIAVAAMFALSANALSAADNAATSTNRSGSVMTNAAAPDRMRCADAADAARASASTNLLALLRMDSSVTVSSNAETFSADACCSETRTFRNDFALQMDTLTKTPSDASAHRAVRFFRDAVISVGRSGDTAEWRDHEPATFDRYPANVSWAGGDAAARIEPRGLKLFSWSW